MKKNFKVLRVRTRWCEHGEKSTKYFLNLENRIHVKKHVQKLKINGSITTDPFKILSEEIRFYQEFYSKFWAIISKPFINCVKQIFTSGEMSRSQKQAVITLIEKRGKDRSLLENLRPISLVNVDGKIISKVLATRIKNVLLSIIHHNQSGFVKDRFKGETVRSIFDLMEFSLKENIPGLMIFIDFQKAFDSLELNFLFCCLEAFGFGLEFIWWVRTLYHNIESCVINNGLATAFFLWKGA